MITEAMVKSTKPTRKAFAERMTELGEIYTDMLVLEADIGKSTNSLLFKEAYPDRYFNMGIAELGMMTAAAGMASCGRKVVACSYGVFLTTRAVEAVRSMICYPNLDVKIFASHGGLTAAIDGVTHQATEDIAFMTTLPNMKVLVPSDTHSSRALCDTALGFKGPAYIRLFRDTYYEIYKEGTEFPLGGSHKLRKGKDVTIATYGDMVFQALKAADTLAAEGVECEVLDLYSVKPLDTRAVLDSVRNTGRLLVAENHQKRNGVGYEICNALIAGGFLPVYDHIGLSDTFAESGQYPDVLNTYEMNDEAIAEKCRKMMSMQ